MRLECLNKQHSFMQSKLSTVMKECFEDVSSCGTLRLLYTFDLLKNVVISIRVMNIPTSRRNIWPVRMTQFSLPCILLVISIKNKRELYRHFKFGSYLYTCSIYVHVWSSWRAKPNLLHGKNKNVEGAL